ncbi:hypothetical protein MUN89_07770 [Halobacillus salinarum]|uniref:Uncharacterized protein n=1 Tax=Halobacillus salinarum TaxID=2932257 RepID=A0ABY4EMY3_9BACI|nr:hypothetical protein [Halobacillus salinarum]UOQ45816.1 hypothetical protein MUN89_07770 [Halobacillus salinarum]
MRRSLEYKDTELVVKLGLVIRLFALKKEVRIPYHTIKSTVVDYFKPPAWTVRMPGTSISPLNIFEGTFKYQDNWYFLSYEHQVPLVIIELSGHQYRFVVIELDKPEQVAAEIRSCINYSYL